MFENMTDFELIEEFNKCREKQGFCKETGEVNGLCTPFVMELNKRGYGVTAGGEVVPREDLI